MNSFGTTINRIQLSSKVHNCCLSLAMSVLELNNSQSKQNTNMPNNIVGDSDVLYQRISSTLFFNVNRSQVRIRFPQNAFKGDDECLNNIEVPSNRFEKAFNSIGSHYVNHQEIILAEKR